MRWDSTSRRLQTVPGDEGGPSLRSSLDTEIRFSKIGTVLTASEALGERSGMGSSAARVSGVAAKK